jgi:hypothetical protein
MVREHMQSLSTLAIWEGPITLGTVYITKECALKNHKKQKRFFFETPFLDGRGYNQGGKGEAKEEEEEEEETNVLTIKYNNQTGWA